MVGIVKGVNTCGDKKVSKAYEGWISRHIEGSCVLGIYAKCFLMI